MKRTALIIATSAFLWMGAPAFGADFDAGVKAFHEGDYAGARAALAPLAAKGDGVAQYYVGVMAFEGRGVKQDYAAAFRWLSFAAVAGVREAQHLMGGFYLDEKLGIDKNLDTAIGWFEESAAQEYPPAQLQLGLMYRDGNGKPQSYLHAEEMFRKAAEQGLAAAQFELGNLYFKGMGVPQDYVRALKWSHRAAAQAHIKAQVNLGYLYGAGKGTDQDFVEAHKWFNLAAAAGDEEGLAGRETVALQMSDRQVIEAQQVAGGWNPAYELDTRGTDKPATAPFP